MGRPRKVRPNWNELATIWTVSDELWSIIQPILAQLDPPKRTGRPRVDARAALDALIFRMRSGCQWNQLPERFPDDSSVHRTFQRWVHLGVFERIWSTLLARCEELGGGLGVASRRRDDGQSSAGGDLIGRNPTDRGKRGVKRSLLVEEAGGPLAVVIAGANVHDTTLLAATLEAVVVARPHRPPSTRSTCVWTWATTIPPVRMPCSPTSTSRICAASGRRSCTCSPARHAFPLAAGLLSVP